MGELGYIKKITPLDKPTNTDKTPKDKRQKQKNNGNDASRNVNSQD